VRSYKKICKPISFSHAEMNGFRTLSGDNNPIHHDIGFAKDRGLRETVTYGGLVFARLSEHIGNLDPGPGALIMSVNIEFKKPLHPDSIYYLFIQSNRSEGTRVVEHKFDISDKDASKSLVTGKFLVTY